MDIDKIRQFLIEANRNGYGNTQIKDTIETDGSHTITYENEDWRFHDNYFGGEPFGGREVISYRRKGVWMMVYYGLVEDISLQNETYTFLKESLLLFHDDQPYRGPAQHENGDWLYINKVEGSFDSFRGEEMINHKGQEVYKARYQGGVVDR
ncbi:MAG TPA: DUF5680 domain-containing protein [Candidatus Saccharimonadales bacterium]|jgi:hypothetical protein|nr:DUF5680 domain-containing protein [Candidatus Saccharimonadales bacterium]